MTDKMDLDLSQSSPVEMENEIQPDNDSDPKINQDQGETTPISEEKESTKYIESKYVIPKLNETSLAAAIDQKELEIKIIDENDKSDHDEIEIVKKEPQESDEFEDHIMPLLLNVETEFVEILKNQSEFEADDSEKERIKAGNIPTSTNKADLDNGLEIREIRFKKKENVGANKRAKISPPNPNKSQNKRKRLNDSETSVSGYDKVEEEILIEKMKNFDYTNNFKKVPTDNVNDVVHQCLTCLKILRKHSRTQLYTHQLIHDDYKPICCRFCNFRTTAFQIRDQHEQSAHSDKATPTPKPNMGESEYNEMEERELVRIMKNFDWRNDFVQLETESELVKDQLFKCLVCEAVIKFHSKFRLYTHKMRYHSEQKPPFACRWCSYRTFEPDSRTKHERKTHLKMLIKNTAKKQRASKTKGLDLTINQIQM